MGEMNENLIEINLSLSEDETNPTDPFKERCVICVTKTETYAHFNEIIIHNNLALAHRTSMGIFFLRNSSISVCTIRSVGQFRQLLTIKCVMCVCVFLGLTKAQNNMSAHRKSERLLSSHCSNFHCANTYAVSMQTSSFDFISFSIRLSFVCAICDLLLCVPTLFIVDGMVGCD